MEEIYFDHEKLRVYQDSVAFVAWTQDLLEKLPAQRTAVISQIDRASTSIPLNIAEGNGNSPLPIDQDSLTTDAAQHLNPQLASTSWWQKSCSLQAT